MQATCIAMLAERSKITLQKHHFVQQKETIIKIIIIIKKDWQCKAVRGRLTPYQSEYPSPTLPTYRGKEVKGKIVEDKKGEQLGQQKGIGPALETRQSHTIEYEVNQIVQENGE